MTRFSSCGVRDVSVVPVELGRHTRRCAKSPAVVLWPHARQFSRISATQEALSGSSLWLKSLMQRVGDAPAEEMSRFFVKGIKTCEDILDLRPILIIKVAVNQVNLFITVYD